AGGHSFTVDLHGDGLVQLEVARDSEGNKLSSHAKKGTVENAGEIITPQGTVVLTANDAEAVVSGVINRGSISQATNARIVGGQIILDGGNEANPTASGKFDTSRAGNGTTADGGKVNISGRNVKVHQAQIVTDAGTNGR